MILSFLLSGIFQTYLESSIKDLFNDTAFLEWIGNESLVEEYLQTSTVMIEG